MSSIENRAGHGIPPIPNEPRELVSDDGVIKLTPYSLDDAEEIFNLIDRNREHLSQYNEDTAIKYPELAVLVDSISNPRNPNRQRLAIKNNEGVIVGAINLTPDPTNPQTAEIGYWQGEEFGGKGYMGRAVKTLTDNAFSSGRFKTLYARVFWANTPSVKVLKKAGYSVTKKGAEEYYLKYVKHAPVLDGEISKKESIERILSTGMDDLDNLLRRY